MAGLAASRAKQIAEQLMGPRSKLRADAKNRAEVLVEEGRHAAAEVVGALRREVGVIVADLQALEDALREGGDGSQPAAASRAEKVPGPTGKKSPAARKASTAGKAAVAQKSAVAKKSAVARKAGVAAKPAKKSAPPAKKQGRRPATGRA